MFPEFYKGLFFQIHDFSKFLDLANYVFHNSITPWYNNKFQASVESLIFVGTIYFVGLSTYHFQPYTVLPNDVDVFVGPVQIQHDRNAKKPIKSAIYHLPAFIGND